MGQIHAFGCQNCGYSGSTAVGGDRATFTEYSAFPVCCRTCKAVTSMNTASEAAPACGKCGSTDVLTYGPQTRVGAAIAPAVDDTWDDNAWTNGFHLCPACGGYTLTFQAWPHIFFD